MNIRYAKLFEIRLLHLYYTGRVSSDLRLVPTMPTVRMFSKYRLVMRGSADGVVVLAPVQGNPAKLQFPISLSEEFRLVFKLEMANPYFLNFTDLPFTKPLISYLKPLKMGYYFSNLQNNPLQLTTPTQDLKLLSKKNASPVSDEDRLPFWTQSLRIYNDPAANTLTYKIKDASDTEVFSETINTPDPFSEFAPEQPPYLPPGIYKLTKDGGAEERVYIDDEVYHAPPFGLVEIHHSTAVHDDNKFVQAGTSNTPVFQSYHLLFDARSTTWRYRFPGGLAGVTAVKKGATNFAKKDAEKLFEAPAAIKMTDEYQTVQMTISTGDKNIPNPSVEAIKPDQVSGKIYADVFL